jgi:glycerol-3-phosphate dehydrogenase subunit B
VIAVATREFDVLVIGEGLAGAMAAAAAASEGCRVGLVAKGPGTFVLADGCIDFEKLDPRLEPEKGFGREIEFFLTTAAAAGCEYRGRLGERIAVPTLLGTFRHATFAPLCFGEFDLRRLTNVIVGGIPSLFDFDARFIAERLMSKARVEGRQTNYSARQLQISYQGEPPHLEIEFAAQFDRNPRFREAVVTALASVAANADLLIIPGFLGVNTTTEELRDIWGHVGCRICEVASLPPSVLGMRLLGRLEDFLTRTGVELLTGFALRELCWEGEHCRGVLLDTPGRPRRLEAEAVVVATGAFSHLLDARAGMESNVFVCGGALQLSDPRTENAVAIVTAFRAGTHAAKLGVQYAGR